jgi:hypothetical protein
MNIVRIDPANVGTFSLSHREAVVSGHGWRWATQFWSCISMSCFLLLHGAWTLYNLKDLGTESLELQGSRLIAVVYCMIVPSFAYFAWQAWRQSSPATAPSKKP